MAVLLSVAEIGIQRIMSATTNTSRVDLLVSVIGDIVRDLSGTAIDRMDPATRFLDMGFDSEFMTQAGESVLRKFGLNIALPELLHRASSPIVLAEYLDRILPSDKFASPHLSSDRDVFGEEDDESRDYLSTLHATPEYRAGPSMAQSNGVEGIIAQQLAIMQQQLAVLAAHGFAAPTSFPGAGPMPAMASILPNQQLQEPDAPAFDFGETDQPARPLPTLFKQPEPLKPIDRGGTGSLTARQSAHVEALIARYTARTAKSKAQARDSRARVADPLAVVGFKQIWKEIVYPIVCVRSAGARIWDTDGNEYVDVAMDFGVNVFGHNPDFVSRAIKEQTEAGLEIGPQSPVAADVASLICDLTGLDRVAFCDTGSEAFTASVRIARAVTGRSKVVYFSPVRALPIPSRVSQAAAEDSIVLEYGSSRSLEFIREYAHQLAAVLIDPVQSANTDMTPKEFLKTLRQITADNGVALIFDEVVTGFCSHLGGAQALFGVKADLATYGELTGGGMPFGVMAGTRTFMDALDGGSWSYGDASFPEAGVTSSAGAFMQYPLALAAARVVLRRLKAEGPALQEGLNARTSKFVGDLNSHFKSVGAPVRLSNFGSLFSVHYDIVVEWGSLLWHHLREKGINIWEGRPCFLSTAHTDDDIEYLSWAFKSSVAEMQEGGFLDGETHPLGPRPVLKVQPKVEAPAESFAEPEPEAESALSESVPEPPAAPAPEAKAVEPVILSAPIAQTIPEIRSAPAAEPRPVARPAPVELPVPEPDLIAPLSNNQREIWMSARTSDNASRAFNESVALHLRGPLDVDALRKALDSLVMRHQAFRTTFSGGDSVQIIASAGHIELRTVDLSQKSLAEADANLTQLLLAEGSQLFDLEKGPLFSVCLVKMDELYQVLSVTGHQIVFDDWSLDVAMRELSALYTAANSGTPLQMPVAPLYTQYAQDQRAVEGSSASVENEAYWVNQRSGDAPVLALPTDRQRQSISAYVGARATITVPGGLLTGIRVLGAKHGCTLYATMWAAWTALLVRLTGQNDIVVGMPAAGQQNLDNSNLIGNCATLLPLRFKSGLETNFVNHLKYTQEALNEAHDHQSCGRMPPVATMLNIHRRPAALDFSGLTHEITDNPRRYYRFDLDVDIIEFDKELLIEANYDSSLYEPEAVQRWLGCFERLLQSAAIDPNRAIGDLSVISDSERRLVVHDWTGVATNYPHDASIVQLFEEMVQSNPDRVAATCLEFKITYGQLNAYSNQLARHLRQEGVSSGDLVGVMLDRSVEMLICLVAILKAGAAYLPLNVVDPAQRVAAMLSEGSVSLVVTQRKYTDKTSGNRRRQVFMDTDWSLIAANEQEDLSTRINGDSLAYAMFTSDSAGIPKGVLVRHRGVVRLVRSVNYASLGQEETFLHLTPLALDGSTFEVWAPLLNGGRLVIAPPDEYTIHQIGEQISANGVTTLWLTSNLFNDFIDSYPEGLRPLRQVLISGEALSVPRVTKALNVLPDIRFMNTYGPMEGTTLTCCHSIAAADMSLGSVPIGRPISNTAVYLLDTRMQPVPVGIEGDLYIGGDGLAAGYLNDDNLSRERFVANVFSDDPTSRLYRSGDKARWLNSGCIELRSRVVRVDPLRIENVSRSLPEVREPQIVAETPRAPVAMPVATPAYAPGFSASAQEWTSLVPIQPRGDRPALYCVHDDEGAVSSYKALCLHLGEGQPVWGIKAPGLGGAKTPETKVENLAACYVQDLLSANPDGPYLLCGHSFGGILAFEIGRQIRETGRRVDFLGLIDTYAPSYFRDEDPPEGEPPMLVRAMDHLNAWRLLDSRDRKVYFDNRIKNRKRHRRNENSERYAPADAQAQDPAALQAIRRATEKATLEYFPKPYPVEMFIFRAIERLDWTYKDRLMGWGGLADNVMVRDVLGDHYTTVEEPCVRILAREMRRALDDSLAWR